MNFARGFNCYSPALNLNQTSFMLAECSKGLFFKPDTSINSICLLNVSCIDDNDIFKTASFDEFVSEMRILTRDKEQVLVISIYPGSLKREFAHFQVSYAKDNMKSTELISMDSIFVTESNIKLGMCLEKLLTIKGIPNDRWENENMNILSYRIDDFNNSDFLKHYNMPQYEAKYVFKDNHLVTFEFGFPNP